MRDQILVWVCVGQPRPARCGEKATLISWRAKRYGYHSISPMAYLLLQFVTTYFATTVQKTIDRPM